ncbi:NAD-P-binding protein [Ramaria rubella]|nr:NAD-P-binding protein [Ramaria rubella]
MGASSSKYNPQMDVPDLHGKVIIVTGGNGGIGLATVRHLAGKGAKVYIASRNESKCAAAISQLEREGVIDKGGEGCEIKFLKLDLIDPRKAKKSAEEFMKMEDRLDILSKLNDHGKPSKSDDGIITSMATNHLGPHVFTRTLLPLLKSTAERPDADVRIITVGSEAHKFTKKANYSSKEEWNNLFKSTLIPSMRRYSYSKLATHLNVNTFARRLDKGDAASNNKITLLLVDPGAVLTDGAKDALRAKLGPLSGFFIRISAWLYFMDPSVGSHSSVFAATAPEIRNDRRKWNGAYILPGNKTKNQTKLALDVEKQEELWTCTERILKEFGVDFNEV